MAGLKKNVSGQTVTFCMVTTAGAADASATVAGFVTKDGGSQASAGGSVTNCGNGQYSYAPTQAETNATDVGFLFTASGDVPVNLDFHTDAVDANGLVSVNAADIGGTAQTGRDIGASVLISVGTGTGQLNLSSGKVPATLASTDITGNVPADLQTIKTQTVTCSAGVTVGAFVGSSHALTVDSSGRVDLGSILGTASTGAAGYVGIDWSAIHAPTSTVALSNTTISVSGSPPTADQIAQTILKYDQSTITGEALYSPINALRRIRDFDLTSNPGKITVKKEDGSAAYTLTLSFGGAVQPILGISG